MNEIKVDRKSKILFVILSILIVGSVAVTYWRYMVQRDYIVQSQIDCDPESETCFIWQCDPASTVEGEACTGVPDNDIWYYKIFRRNAKNIPDCDPADENCPAYVCDGGEKDCGEELCSPENMKEGEECNDPAKYLEENPPTDDSESEECPARNASQIEAGGAPDDQECLDVQNAECDPENEDCPAAGSEECAPDDANCETQPAEEAVPIDSSEDIPSNSTAPDKNIPPLGVEPQ